MCHRHAHARRARHRHAHWKRHFNQHFNRPPANISEKEDHFEILLFVPGMDKEGLNLQVKNDELFILYKAPKDSWDQDEIVTDFTEEAYTQASFRRSFRLNNKALVEEISATYNDGVLKVILPKNPETNRPVHTITVEG
ncbi:Hsp20/alpha crystallin family protein [Flavilitoribacter nigricans]|uniref:Heat-shock protein Hsp20 n=1 Tax=Flavilitoribacter nigricans (strain ATCC 23147 / DSM 23189 / NBRC 102662 / NCIMB 1420 / SS-2) TaxID=1122177 RepID=A0A2D0NH74_FLAN2|nr:Hsp20/alpha crystallin family protein [Flavilitoribacter nigricans]PHN07736.1 heat-shock protein Hsp20 [Flavilitoribacter nigricans DSM 23189 = NBRC 102662]